MDVNFMDHGDRTMAGAQFASAGFFLRAHFLHRAFARARAPCGGVQPKDLPPAARSSDIRRAEA